VKRPGIFFAVLACASLAGCAGPYRAPVVERSVARPSAAQPAAPAAEQRPESYTVKRGDTLYSIALDNGLDYRDVAAWNNITDPAAIKAGMVLRMRPPGPAVTGQPQAGTQVQPGAGVQVQPAMGPGAVEARSIGADPRAAVQPPQIASGLLKTGPKAMKLPYSEENLAMLLRQSPPPPAPEPPSPQPSAEDGQDTVAWMWPATGRVLAGFSEATNKGVDILGKIGDPVFASASGRVVYSGVGLRGYGKLVIIKHNQTYLSAYAHNSNLLVKEGQNVARGQKIAEIGSTDSSQAKLHFEIRRLGKPIDPLKLLPDRPS
jgi:lipoprotein NlpD